MKTEAEIHQFLKYLQNLSEHNFSDQPRVYTSIFQDEENGMPDIFEGDEASKILGNLQIVMETLELILEEPMTHKPIERATGDEVRRFKGKIMLDGNDRLTSVLVRRFKTRQGEVRLIHT